MLVPLTAIVLFAVTPAPKAGLLDCPAGVISQLEGLYEWQIRRLGAPGHGDLTLHRDRFTPALYQELHRAWTLDPHDDGAYLDFDVFSGTQMVTYGASIQRCRRLASGAIDAQVAVAWGRGGQPVPKPSLLDYRMVRDGKSWQISEITYHGDHETYTLTRVLATVLEAVSR